MGGKALGILASEDYLLPATVKYTADGWRTSVTGVYLVSCGGVTAYLLTTSQFRGSRLARQAPNMKK